MNRSAQSRLFDEMADEYDRLAHDSTGYPFEAYDDTLLEITRAACIQRGMKVLDLGIGTGNLAIRLADLGCEIWGVDFSTRMLAKAAEKLPDAILVHADILCEWPAELDRRFDRIVSAYVLHGFDDATKVSLLAKLCARYLQPHGRVVVGDVVFPTARARDEARKIWKDRWDDDEHYWVADEAIVLIRRAGLDCAYRPVSSCAGVFTMSRGHPQRARCIA